LFSLVLQIVKFVLIRVASTGILAWLNPYLLKADKWLEKHLHIDLIKQEKKFYEKYRGVENSIRVLEDSAHPMRELDEMAGFEDLMKRIETLEKKL